MIHKMTDMPGGTAAMTGTESGESRYRTYIQKRRIASPAEDREKEEPAQDSGPFTMPEPETRSLPRIPSPERYTAILPEKAEPVKPAPECREPVHAIRERFMMPGRLADLRKRDHPLYRKMYTRQKPRKPAYPSGRSYISQRAQVEDNRATLIAIKIIKQALACFAILGLVVLMQGRPDMQETLAFMRRHIVETHIDPGDLVNGVKSVFSQLVRNLGGGP